MNYITWPYLEQRLLGIGIVKEYIRRSQPHLQTAAEQPPPRKLEGLTAQALAEWIAEQNLVLTLLDKYLHVEVVKRCGSMIKLLARYNILTLDIIDMLWHLAQTSHESIVRELFNLISLIVSSLSVEER
jgi:hypothetical protein